MASVVVRESGAGALGCRGERDSRVRFFGLLLAAAGFFWNVLVDGVMFCAEFSSPLLASSRRRYDEGEGRGSRRCRPHPGQ